MAAVNIDPTSVQLHRGFGTRPVVISQATGVGEGMATIGRPSDGQRDRFSLRLQSDERSTVTATMGGSQLPSETLNFLVLDRFKGAIGPHRVEVGILSDVNETPGPLSFDLSHVEPSAFFIDPQSFNGPDPIVIAHGLLTSNGVEVFLREDTSFDTETEHVPEDVGYVMLSRR